MTAEEFSLFWASTYPDTLPIPHYFKHDYANRWFRIHSLPGSQRYPGDEEDWKTLLERQNTILTDLLGEGSRVLLVVGDYKSEEGYIELHPLDNAKSVKPFTFTRLKPIDIYSLNPGFYEKGQLHIPLFAEAIWRCGGFDDVLKDIAEGNLEAFFISIVNGCIVAPYDGGMDMIVKDSATKDLYKATYAQWLSSREDGM